MKWCAFLLLLISFFAWTEEEATEIFETYKDAIVYVQQTLYFKSSYVANPQLFQRLEKHQERNILDTYFPIATGSGFFISPEGHIITNHHVIDKNDLAEMREDALWGFLQGLSRVLPEDLFSSREFEKLMDDFEVLYKKSEFFYRVIVKNEDHYTPDILGFDKELDLALLKIKGDDDFTAIPIGDSDALKVGHSVIAIGYPLQFAFEYFTKDLKSTLSKGNISAIRDENNGIQHTAFVTFGNSGGPLLNITGEVVGINVSILDYGADIFFSIPSNKLISWLKKSNRNNLVTLNEETAVMYTRGSSSVITGKKKVLETGPTLFIKLEKPYEVYVGETLKGTTPLLINDLTPGEHFLRIESAEEYHGIKLIVTSGRSDIVTYSPAMGKFMGNIFVDSTPPGAAIYIDEKKMGETPSALSDIIAENHSLKLIKEGYWTYKEEISVKKKETITLSIELEKGYTITFQNSLPENTVIKVSGNDEEYTFSEKDTIMLRAGTWTFTLKNKIFEDLTLTYDIEQDKKISAAPVYHKTTVKFVNLLPGSRVLLDDRDITDRIEDLSYSTRLGERTVRIKTSMYLDYCETIDFQKDKEVVVEPVYVLSPAVAGKRNAWIGYPALGGGILLLAGGLLINNNTIAIALSSTYDGYVALKWTGFSIGCAGIISATVGTIFVFISMNDYRKAKVTTEFWKTVRFSCDLRDSSPAFMIHIPLKQ